MLGSPQKDNIAWPTDTIPTPFQHGSLLTFCITVVIGREEGKSNSVSKEAEEGQNGARIVATTLRKINCNFVSFFP